jgi:16S rRNA G1207 methylase RsmC
VIASTYDFGRWGSLMDVGGGNGILLAAILKAHPRLRGVLADLRHFSSAHASGAFSEAKLKSAAPCWTATFLKKYLPAAEPTS